MVRSRINKSRYCLNKKRFSKIKKSILNGGEIIKYADGNVYDGEVVNGKKHGKGIMTYANGDSYDGDWKNNNRVGTGIFKWANGHLYVGSYKNDAKEGKGVFTFANGDEYDGDWKNDYMNGTGIFKWGNGDIYVGSYKKGLKEGKGVYTDASGNSYDGDWKYGNKNGIGMFTWIDGKVYNGEFKDGYLNGRGVITWPDGKVFDGEWEDGEMHGRGKMTYSSGNIYRGEWKYGKRHGQGKMVFSKSSGYMEGEYINDLQEGMHTHITEDGQKKKYYFNRGKIYNFEADIDKYLISKQKDDTSNRYITILINLHGGDIINSKCALVHNKHVRCITPVKCGQFSMNDTESNIEAFLIAYNISNLQINSNASTYQKMMKIIEVYNEHNPNFYDLTDGAIGRPLIDHYYRAVPIDDIFKQIFIIDTNHMIDIFRDNYHLFSRKNAELKTVHDLDIEQYNILSKLIPHLNINHLNERFLRSNLINVLLDFGYDTINIIDFSCRVYDEDWALRNNLTDLYTRLPNKDYVCNYIEKPDEKTFIGDEITSIHR